MRNPKQIYKVRHRRLVKRRPHGTGPCVLSRPDPFFASVGAGGVPPPGPQVTGDAPVSGVRRVCRCGLGDRVSGAAGTEPRSRWVLRDHAVSAPTYALEASLPGTKGFTPLAARWPGPLGPGAHTPSSAVPR